MDIPIIKTITIFLTNSLDLTEFTKMKKKTNKAIRRFRKIGGFDDATDFIEVRDEKIYLVIRNSSTRVPAGEEMTLPVILAFVYSHHWEEIKVDITI